MFVLMYTWDLRARKGILPPMNEISFVQQPDPIDGDHKSVEWWGSVPAKKEGQKVHCLTASWQMHGKEKIMLLQ